MNNHGVDFENLINKTLIKIKVIEHKQIIFVTENNGKFRIVPENENMFIEFINDRLDKFLGFPLLAIDIKYKCGTVLVDLYSIVGTITIKWIVEDSTIANNELFLFED